MKTSSKLFLGAALAAAVAASALAQKDIHYSVKDLAPAVVKTVPQAGKTDVDPALKEITVTFSKDMADKSWSVPQTTPDEFFPEFNGDIHYAADKRTCIIPVKLKPGRTYVVWFNQGKYQNFRDTNGRSAVPYMLVFETRK